MICDQRSSGEDGPFEFEEGHRGRGKPVPLSDFELVFMLLFCLCSSSTFASLLPSFK